MDTDDGTGLVRIERRRAVDDVYHSIREAILNRRFAPGIRLNVEELASQLGVSLTPVRSAIQLLAADGLIDVHSRSGTYVATLTRRDLEETFDIRCALECLAGEKAVHLVTEAHLASARSLLVVLKRPVKTDAHRKTHEQANSDFHGIIVRGSGNQRLADIYDSLRAHIAMWRLHRMDESWQSRLPQEQREHEEILAALERRDAAALTRALRRHILRSKETLLARTEISE